MQQRQQFNFASALTGFAVGALVAGLAVIQFVPGDSDDHGGGLVPLSLGAGPAAVGDVGRLDEGQQLAVTDSGGLAVVDESGNVVRTVESSGGGATGSDGGTRASAGGQSGSGVDVAGGGSGTGPSGSGSGDGTTGGGAACEGKGGATDVGVRDRKSVV